ncbi:MAG: potassium-transporting ATPase KdpC subunit [Solirubrobacteraceae bacterium]|jgi:K+-transporting ATPase ATPase C chain|nr:potassium-transporting ATPase KdpC subunit [Solirubrobacteraceae bacterium]
MRLRNDLLTAALAVLLFTVVLGLAYPLAMTGIAQVAFPNKANGSQIEVGGKVVGSRLIARAFTTRGHRPDPRYFQPRPSQTSYNATASAFSNRGPNAASARFFYRDQLASYLALESPYDPGLTRAGVPVDAVTTSASGVDPHISPANARIQARRVAAVRHLPLARVSALVAANTDGRFLGVIGEPGVNVLELNLALDKEAPGR